MRTPRFIRSSVLPFLLSSVLLSSVLLAACGSPFSDAPPVPDSTLVSVLAELYLAEAHEQLRLRGQLGSGARAPGPAPAPGDSSSTSGVPPALRDSILAYHGLTRAKLQAALDYYARHPEQYTKLYDRALDRLNARRSVRSSQRNSNE